METPNLFVSTGQERLLKWGAIIFFLGIGIIYLGGAGPIVSRFPGATVVIALFGGVVAVVGALIPLYRIRCPKCSLPWLRWAMRHRPANDWLQWLYRFGECPWVCG